MKPEASIILCATLAELAKRAAEKIRKVIHDSTAARGICTVALSGGETPRRLYYLLGDEPFRTQIDWSGVQIFFSDERMVPPDSAQSNYKMVKEELLSRIPIPADNVHRILGEIDPAEAAKRYEAELKQTFANASPRFDFILLGIGGEGHTASLFPGTDALDIQDRLAAAVFVRKLNTWRVTLTLLVINNSRQVAFLVSGKEKAPIVRKVLSTAVPQQDVPASLVCPRYGNLIWMLDADAASLVKDEPWMTSTISS